MGSCLEIKNKFQNDITQYLQLQSVLTVESHFLGQHLLKCLHALGPWLSRGESEISPAGFDGDLGLPVVRRNPQ